MAVTVSRMSGGRLINGDEYARDGNGNLIVFINIGLAQDFLLRQGIPEEELDHYFYCEDD